MSRVLRPSALVRHVAALVAALALLAPSAVPIRAASDTFGMPTATVEFGTAITFLADYASSGNIERAELRLLFPGAIGRYLIPLPTPSTRSGVLRYMLDTTGGGNIRPNTLVQASFAITTADGTEVSDEVSVRYLDTTHAWRTAKGGVVTVHWYLGSDSFGQHAAAVAAKAMLDLGKLYGVAEDAPIEFYLYGDSASFRKAMGTSTTESVGGTINSASRTAYGLVTSADIAGDYVATMVPHELDHIVFDDAVSNPFGSPPFWMNEGLAVYFSEGYGSGDRALLASAIDARDVMPLRAYASSFPRDAGQFRLAYAEAVSAIDFLVRSYGRTALLKLVLAYKSGLTDDEAFDQALGTDLAGFQTAWLKGIGAATPEQYGPQPAPAGPVPPDWNQTPPDGSGASASPAPSGATSSAAPTPRPSSGPADGGNGQGTETSLILFAVVVVAGAVLGGLVLAGRRARA